VTENIMKIWLRGLAMHRSRPTCRFDTDCQSSVVSPLFCCLVLQQADLSLLRWGFDPESNPRHRIVADPVLSGRCRVRAARMFEAIPVEMPTFLESRQIRMPFSFFPDNCSRFYPSSWRQRGPSSVTPIDARYEHWISPLRYENSRSCTSSLTQDSVHMAVPVMPSGTGRLRRTWLCLAG
jgi:hypothetical protein